MANLKEIRSRITTVKNTRKITSAMGRIASARLRRAQNLMEAARPYGTRMRDVVGQLVAELGTDEVHHPLLRQAEELRRVALVVVTADRGLCGGFNANASRRAAQRLTELQEAGKEVEVYCVGRKGASNLRHRGFRVERVFAAPGLEDVVERAAEVAALLRERFVSENVDAVEVVYNHFTNVITQSPELALLLPVPSAKRAEESSGKDRIFEPSREVMLESILPMAVETMIQQFYFNSVASEVASRRTAMDNATDNASQLIGELTLIYNRERQAAITKELMEIIGGAEALKG